MGYLKGNKYQLPSGLKQGDLGAVFPSESLQFGSLVALHRDEVVIALFVIPDEEVFGVGLRV